MPGSPMRGGQEDSGDCLWLNGAFGAGKTTVVEALEALLPDAMVYDPEEVGFMLGRLVPASPTGDFQDLPVWRRLVVSSTRRIAAGVGRARGA